MTERTTMSGRPPYSCAYLVILCLPALNGCSSPLGPIQADYGQRTPTQRLRQIDSLDRDKYAVPAPATPELPAAGRPYPSRFAGLPTISMTVEEARAAALTNNLDLKVVLVDPTIQTELLRVEEAKFEAVFRPSASYTYVNNPTLETTQPQQQNSTDLGAGVDIPLRGGGRASVDFTQDLTKTPPTPGVPSFFNFDTAYTSLLNFSLSQPLLRNAGRRANTNSIRIAAYNRDIAESRTKLEIIRQVANADRAYWRVYAALQALEVRQKQYELAVAQLERAKRRFDAGDAPELEVTRAESGAASQLDQIIQAEKNVLDTQRDFKRLVNIPGLGMETKTQVIPSSQPDPVRFQFNPTELADLGVTNRMEMLELELQLAADYSNIEYAKNQALPDFTLNFNYGIPGLGQTLNQAADQLRSAEYQNWNVGVTGNVPIGNEAAKAKVQQAILTRLQRLASKDARRLSIQQEVLQAVDALEAAWQQIMASRQAVILAAKTYEGEKRQFEAGARTSTDVLNAAATLADEQTNEVRALTDYQIAQVDLAFATGTLLGAGKIDWSPGDPRVGQPAQGDPTPFSLPLYPDPDRARKPADVEIERAKGNPPDPVPARLQPGDVPN